MASVYHSDGGAVAPRALAPIVSALLLCAACGAPAPQNASAQHLLLLTLDTLRADALGAYGRVDAETPHLDGLAASGALFENAYTTCNVTGPSHASILTGLYPPRHGMLGNAWQLDASVQGLAPRLARAGFDTAGFVSSAVLSTASGLARGFAAYDQDFLREVRFERTLQRRGDATVDAAAAWLSARAGAGDAAPRRLFLWVHLFDAHAPYDPPEPFARGAPRPPSDAATLEAIATGQLRPSPETLEAMRALYRAEVRYLDHQVGRLLAALGPLRSETLVVAVADHGEELAEHLPFFEHNRSLYQGVTRVPLILAGPGLGLRAGQRVAAPVQLVDVMPTALEGLGLSAPPELDGVSLRPWLAADAEPAPRPFALVQRPHNPGFYPRGDAYAYLRGTSKLVLYDRGPPELYDLAADPGETRSRWAASDPAHAALRREARARVASLDARGASVPRSPITLPAQREMLRALGYAVDGPAADPPAAD